MGKIKERDVVLYRDTFAQVVFLWKTKAVIMVGKRIFEVSKRDIKPIDPDVIAMTFEMLRNDYSYVA